MLSRLARSLFAATCAALILGAPAPSIAAPAKGAAADVKDATKAKKGDAKKDDARGAKADKSDKAASSGKPSKSDKNAKVDKSAKAKDKADKDDAKSAQVDKKAKDKADKDDAKSAKVDKKAAKDKADKDSAKVDKKAAKDKADKDDAKSAKVDKKAKDKADKADKDSAKVDVKGTASIGAPNKGRLQNPVKLHSSRSLKLRERAHGWALPELAKLLQRAAGKVAKHHPRSVLLVGDLSQKTGGPLVGHNSHQSGRDADVGFYVANSHGQPAAMTRFVAFDGQGKSAQVSWAQFDDARNWSLVEALLTDKDTTVRYIFVSTPLRARVLAFAAKKKVAKDLYAKAETVLMAPKDADVHDDHFHVRIACPESMKGFCVEESNAKGGGAPVAQKDAKGGDAKGAAVKAEEAKGGDAKGAAVKAEEAKPAASESKAADASAP